MEVGTMPKNTKDSMAQLLGPEMELELKGTKYTLSALDLNDFAALENHLRSRNVKQFLEATKGDDLPAEIKAETIRHMVSEAIDIDVVMEHFTHMEMSSMVFMMYRALLKKHPDMTPERVGELVSIDEIPKIQSVILGLGESENPKMAEAMS
jgi:hypothetical protein